MEKSTASKDKNLIEGSEVYFENENNQGVVIKIFEVSTSAKRCAAKQFTVLFSSGTYKNQSVIFHNDSSLHLPTRPANFIINKRSFLEDGAVSKQPSKKSKLDCVQTSISSNHDEIIHTETAGVSSNMVSDDNSYHNNDDNNTNDDDDDDIATWDQSNYFSWDLSKKRRFNLYRIQQAEMNGQFDLNIRSTSTASLPTADDSTTASLPCIVVKKLKKSQSNLSKPNDDYKNCIYCLWKNDNTINPHRAMNGHLQHCVTYKNAHASYEYSRRNTRYGTHIETQTANRQNSIQNENLGVKITDNQDEVINDVAVDNSSDVLTDDETTEILQQARDDDYKKADDDDKQKGLPSKKLLRYQQQLIDCFSKNKLLHVRRHRLKSLNGEFENIEGLTDADYVDLASIGILFQNTHRKGDIFLRTMNDIMKRHGLDKDIKFPSCFRTIDECIGKKARKQTQINIIPIPIQPKIWGEVNIDNVPLEKPYDVGFDGGEVIAERYLNSNPSNIQFTPTYPKNNANPPEDVIDSFFAGEVCKRVTASIHNTYGDRYYLPNNPNHPGFRIVVTFIILSEDEAVVDQGRKKSQNTLKMDILNLTGTDASIDLLGIAPQNPLGMSLAEADEHLNTKMKCLQQFRRLEIIQARKRYVHLYYLDQVHKPLREYPNGAFVQLGEDNETEEAEIVVTFFETVAITGDSKALNPFCSVGDKQSMKCRCCNETNCSRFTLESKTWQVRNNEVMKVKTKALGELYESIYLKNLNRSISLPKTVEEEELIKYENDNNVIPGENWMFTELGERMMKLDASALGLCEMTPSDRLHTLIKGPVENSITHTLDCAYLLGNLNNSEYGHIPSSIDRLVRDFPYKGSVFPFKLMNMKNLTKYFTKSRHKRHGAGSSATNHLVGVVSADKIPGIAWILNLVIGDDEMILPRTATSIKKSRTDPNLEENINIELGKWNIQSICQNAIQSTLNVLVCSSRKDGYTEAQREQLQHIIALSRAHMVKLYNLRNCLKELTKGNTDIIVKKTCAYKQHLLEHLPRDIVKFGPPEVVDSQRTEHKHIVFKELYELTSKNSAVMCQQICNHYRIQHCIKRYKNEIQKREKFGNKNIERKSIPKQLVGETIYNINYKWRIAHNVANELLYYDKDLNSFLVAAYRNTADKKKQCNYIHSYVPMDKIGDHLFEGLIQGSEIRNIFLKYITTDDSKIKVKSLSRITCDGDLDIGVEPWSFTCNGFSPRSRFSVVSNEEDYRRANIHISNKDDCTNGIVVTDQDFSYAEINLEGEVVLVRILAIIQFEDPVVMRRLQTQKTNMLPEDFELEYSNVMRKYVALLVLKLEKCNERSLNQPLFKYLGGNKGCEHNIVGLDHVIRPSCVIAKFTELFPPNYKQNIGDLDRARNCFKQRFYHVPIHRNHNIPILGTRSEINDNIFLNRNEMNEINNADPQAGYDSISEVEDEMETNDIVAEDEEA